MALNIDACLLGIFTLYPIVSGSIEAESWTKITVPNDYWLPLNSTDEKAYGNRMACAVGCQLMGQTCKAFLFDEARSSCSFGDIVPTWPDNSYIPEYIMDGKEVSLRKSIIKKKELSKITHIGYLNQGGSSIVSDFVPERPDLMPVAIPPLTVSAPHFGVHTYKNAIVVCGGKLPSNHGDKTCWQWSFKTKQWDTFGETPRFHFNGASTILDDKLYMFAGLNAPVSTGNANRYVDSYDFISGTFQQHADLSTSQDLYYQGIVALPQISKILLVNGREGNYLRARSYLYDPASDTYSLIEDSTILTGSSHTSCAVHPDEDNTVVCAGGWTGSATDGVYLFDVAAETFQELTEDSDRLPFGAYFNLLTINSKLYAVTKDEILLKYSEDDSPRWTALTDTQTPYGYQRNFAYDIDYHELLV